MSATQHLLPTTLTPQRYLADLARAVEEFRVLRETMPAQLVSLFLAIAQRPGIHQRDLPKLVQASHASVSRNVGALGPTDRHGEPGLNLVRRTLGDDGDRSPQLFLTSRGEALVTRLTHPGKSQTDAFEGMHWRYWVD